MAGSRPAADPRVATNRPRAFPWEPLAPVHNARRNPPMTVREDIETALAKATVAVKAAQTAAPAAPKSAATAQASVKTAPANVAAAQSLLASFVEEPDAPPLPAATLVGACPPSSGGGA